jgi:hypothetical protein
MIKIPEVLQKKYSLLLTNRDVPQAFYKNFRKCLLYYLDFCQKFQHPNADENSLLLFLDKLQQKNQPDDQRHQAEKAVQLYYSGFDQANDPQAHVAQSNVAEAGRSFDTEQPANPWSGAMESLKIAPLFRLHGLKPIAKQNCILL